VTGWNEEIYEPLENQTFFILSGDGHKKKAWFLSCRPFSASWGHRSFRPRSDRQGGKTGY
jgi:hypothetical protein